MKVSFEVPRPVGINRGYIRGRILTTDYKNFKERIHLAALAARAKSKEWPRDPWVPSDAVLSYQLYAYKGDTDSVRKVLRDGCEGALYYNDKIVSDGPAPHPIMDGGEPRVVVTVELISVRSQETATKMRIKSEKAALVRLKAKKPMIRKKKSRVLKGVAKKSKAKKRSIRR